MPPLCPHPEEKAREFSPKIVPQCYSRAGKLKLLPFFCKWGTITLDSCAHCLQSSGRYSARVPAFLHYMKQKPSFQFYQQDFLGSIDVQTMTMEEVGCYCMLLFNCYNNGGQIPNDPEVLRSLCHGITPAPRVLRKFYGRGKYLRHRRVDEQYQISRDYSEQQRRNANKRWADAKNKAMPSHSHRIPIASISQCSSSSSSSSNKEYLEKYSYMTDKDFEAFWNSYGKKTGKANCLKKFCKLKSDLLPAILAALEWQKKTPKWQSGFVKDPETWLNGRHWEDEQLIVDIGQEKSIARRARQEQIAKDFGYA